MFESLEAFKMYYVIGASVSSLHRESTDSMIFMKIIGSYKAVMAIPVLVMAMGACTLYVCRAMYI